jgi:HlyD family secretion protein
VKRALILLAALLTTACGGDDTVLQGYGEADYIYLASQESGVVSELLVREGDTVEAGAIVFRLDPERLAHSAQSTEAQRQAAREAVRNARAQVTLTQRNYQRGLELAQRGFYPRATLDADRAARDAAQAQLAQAQREAAAVGAETELAQERLRDLQGAAPAAGTIERIFHRPGEVVAAGEPIAQLLPPQNMKVRFFAPEDMLAQLPMGARVLVSCDGCGDPMPATISFVAQEPQFTPPIIYSLDQREKLVFLIEARLETRGRIRPGMPVDISVAPTQTAAQ